MNKQELHIDFELIRKKHKSELSESEEARLQAWLNEYDIHRDYYNKAMFYLNEGVAFNKHDLDVNKDWIKTNKRFKSKQEGKMLWLRIGASVAASLVIFFSVYFMTNLSDKTPTVADNGELIAPGVKRAELVLSDGSIMKLGEGTEQFKEQDGTLIRTDLSLVTYQDAQGTLADNLYNEVRVNRGEEYQLQLSDGTMVWINSMSSIKYPVHFTANNREVEITGEVYFEVKHNADKPFIVHTPVHDIKVLGTSFNVSCYLDDEVVHTTLVEGSVEVNNVIGGLESVLLAPNKQYALNKTSLKSEIIQVNTDNYTAWTKGYFKFEEQTLGDIFTKLQRWYSIDVFFVNGSARQEYFTGCLPRFENIDTLLALIEKVSNVKFKTNENTIIVN